MARRKNTSVGNLKLDFTGNFLSQFKWGESYVSLLLGVIVVVIAAILVVTFAKSIKQKEANPASQQTMSQKTENIKKESAEITKKTYTVLTGESLWSISEKVYKSGYYWVDIAKANNLENPGFIHSGNVLKLPEVKPLIASSKSVPKANSISGNTYIIQKGDDLWDIAVRAYGDGYKWVDLAKANNLTEPDLIFAGNALKIPR